MEILVAAETLLLVLLVLLVVGLLRSHAEILRRLGPPEAEAADEGEDIPATPDRPAAEVARDVAGPTLAGDAVQVALGPGAPPTLLAFLSTGCDSRARFWEALRP